MQATGTGREQLGWVNPLAYNGGVLNVTTLAQAVAAIGVTKQVLLLTAGDWAVTGNLTIPDNISILAAPNARFNVSGGATLTIHGGLISDEPRQFFMGAGSVILGHKIPEVRPEWFGAVVGADCTDAINDARASKPNGGTIRFCSGVYLYTPPLALSGTLGYRFLGVKNYFDTPAGTEGRTILRANGTATDFINITGYQNRFEELVIDGGGMCTNVIRFRPTSKHNDFQHCLITRAIPTTGTLVHLDGVNPISQIDWVTLRNCQLMQNRDNASEVAENGVWVNGSNAFLNWVDRCLFSGMTTGVRYSGGGSVNLLNCDFTGIASTCILIANSPQATTIEGCYTELAGIRFLDDVSGQASVVPVILKQNAVNNFSGVFLGTNIPYILDSNRFAQSVDVTLTGPSRILAINNTFGQAGNGFFGTGLARVDEISTQEVTGGGTFVSQTRIRNTWRAKRFAADSEPGAATAWTTGNFLLSAEWGSTSIVSGIGATDMRGQFTVESGGTGQAPNPVITCWFADGTWGEGPIVMVMRRAGAQMSVPITVGYDAAGFQIAFIGTPVSGEVYSFSFHTMG